MPDAPVILSVGFGFTVKLLVAKDCDLQPVRVFVPMTVYVLLIEGLTTALPLCRV